MEMPATSNVPPGKAVTLPGSKSIAARSLILNQVYGLGLTLRNLPDCDDTRELAAALRQAFPAKGEMLCDATQVIDLGTGGTSLRFFLALAASIPGFEGILDCSEALRRRPIAPLVEALRSAGADITYLEQEGKAPVTVKGKRLNGRGVNVKGNISSQFASALAMVSDLWETPLETPRVDVSAPYLEMTLRMRDIFREMARQPEHHTEYHIEPDWSAAAFFYEYALLNPDKPVRIERLTPPNISLQGDSATAEIFARLGVGTRFMKDGSAVLETDKDKVKSLRNSHLDFDMGSTPDMVPALAVALCMADIRFTIRGVAHLRAKESDRLQALSEELAKVGFALEIGAESLSWNGKRNDAPVAGRIEFASHGDHRMAMALAAAANSLPPFEIKDAEVVSKSFPDFFNQLLCLR